MVADSFAVVIGVDTHRDSHALALVRCRDGALLGEQVLAANRSGYRAALRLHRLAGGRRLWALEGTAPASPATSSGRASRWSKSSAPPAKGAAVA